MAICAQVPTFIAGGQICTEKYSDADTSKDSNLNSK